jgi:hypothetical protein
MRIYAAIAVILLTMNFLPVDLQAETVYIGASGDNTLIEDPDGARSNGAGPAIFAGRTNQQMNSIRRGVIYFDVASALPADAAVESVSLTLYMTKANNIDRLIRLQRLQRDWGEGASSSGGGQGAPAEPGDATWLHTFYPDTSWGRDGGQYAGRVSAGMMVGDVVGDYTWGSTDRMVQDVNRWLKHPEKNFGWIIIGDESAPQTVVPFASRENPDPDTVPVLEVTYQ